MIVFKKLLPVLGLLAFVAGPVFAADAPPASTPAAHSHKKVMHHHKMATHKHHGHHKKAAKPS